MNVLYSILSPISSSENLDFFDTRYSSSVGLRIFQRSLPILADFSLQFEDTLSLGLAALVSVVVLLLESCLFDKIRILE
jgi:hypothetical protein